MIRAQSDYYFNNTNEEEYSSRFEQNEPRKGDLPEYGEPKK